MTETNQQSPAPPCDPDRTNGGADLFSSPSTKAPSWRDLIKVHPAAKLFPAMADAELDELGKDIIKYGLKQPIVLWTPDRFEDLFTNKSPSEEFLLDGGNRLEAIERQTTDPKQREEAILRALCLRRENSPNSGGAIRLYGDTDPYAYVISANLRRRHLTSRQKRELIGELLKANPERSNREIARIAKDHHERVGTVRAGLEATGEIRQFKKTTGADGKARPARRSISQVVSKPTASAALRRDITISDFSKLLHKSPADTLDDLIRLMRGEQARIAEIPHEKRVAVARGCLRTLEVSLDDLSLGAGSDNERG